MTAFATLRRDLRYAIRTLRKSAGFTLVAVLTLACGIGATTAAFTQLYAVFYKGLPVRDAEALRALSYRDPRRPNPMLGFSHADYVHLRDSTRTFSDLACWNTGSMQPLGERGPINLQFVSADYFRTLGVDPALGRAFTPDDDRAGAAPVAMLSYRVWQRDFGADASALGRTLRIEGRVFDIVGVLPRGFYGLDPTAPHDVMVPHAVAFTRPGNASCRIVGRLRQGASTGQARAEVETLFRESPARPGDQKREEMPLALSPLEPGGGRGGLRERTAPSLRVLMAMTLLVLLTACANVAGLMLVRAAARAREVGTLLALGATRARVARQLLLESLLLAAAGGALGVAMAYALNPVLPRFIVELGGVATLTGEGRPLGVDVSPDRWVLLFCVLLTGSTAILFGIVPALRASSVDVIAMIRQAATNGIRRPRFLSGGAALTAVQVALSMVLLVGVGLFARTLVNLNAVPIGYQPDRLLFATLNPINRPRSFVDDAMRRMEALPGVTTVAASQWPLFNNAEPKLPVCIQGENPRELQLDIEWATPRYFETWGVPFVQGADFVAGGGAQAIVNRTFASRLFPGETVVGRTIGVGQCPGRPTAIVGVVGDHLDRQRADLLPMVYLPYPSGGAFNPTTIALRVDGDARAFVPGVRRIIAGLDSSLTDGDVTTGVDYRNARVRRELILASLLGAFGALALVMSCLGIYGTVAYAVTRQKRELGIRTALGAKWPQIVRTVAGRYGAAVAAGIAAGMAAAVPLSAFVETLLFRVSRVDGRTIAGAVVVIAIAAALAAMRPAWRAATVNPVEALRVE